MIKRAEKIGRKPVKDKRVPVTFMALGSKVKEARKKGLPALNKHLEAALDDFLSR